MSAEARPASLEDLKKILAALHHERADYLLIGGYALLAHGYARATTDIDLLVPGRASAAEPIRRALLVLADRAAGDLVSQWFEEGEGIRIADEIVVDLVFRTCGETFDTLRRFETVIDLDGIPVRTLNLEGLLRTKQSDRERDVSDRRVIEQALRNRSGS